MEAADHNAATQKDKNNKHQQLDWITRMPFRRMLSLVDAAGEVLGLTEDPLATIVGMKIEEMVDDEVDLENWDYSNSDDADICDLILGTPGGELQAVRAFKRR